VAVSANLERLAMRKCPNCGAACDGRSEIVTGKSGRPIVLYYFDCLACNQSGVVTDASVPASELERGDGTCPNCGGTMLATDGCPWCGPEV
jgi:ribosomal protein S27AE